MPRGCGASSSANRLKRIQAAQARAEKRRLAPTHNHASLNRSRAPKRMSADQFDLPQGRLHWPTVLEAPDFRKLRGRLDEQFAERALRPDEAGLGSPNCRQIEQLADQFRDALKAKLYQLKANDFVKGDKFLKSLAYEARFESFLDPAATMASAE